MLSLEQNQKKYPKSKLRKEIHTHTHTIGKNTPQKFWVIIYNAKHFMGRSCRPKGRLSEHWSLIPQFLTSLRKINPITKSIYSYHQNISQNNSFLHPIVTDSVQVIIICHIHYSNSRTNRSLLVSLLLMCVKSNKSSPLPLE